MPASMQCGKPRDSTGTVRVVHGKVVEQLVAGNDHVDDVADVRLHSAQKIVKGLEIVRVAGGGRNALAGRAADAVVQGQFDDLAHVDVRDIGILLHAAGQVGFHAAAGVPVPGFGKRHALVLHHTDPHVVAVNRRHR